MDAEHCDVYPRNVPSVDTFTTHAKSAGVNKASHVVVYSDTDVHGFQLSGRGWWTFKVSVLSIKKFYAFPPGYSIKTTQY